LIIHRFLLAEPASSLSSSSIEPVRIPNAISYGFEFGPGELERRCYVKEGGDFE